MTANVPLAYDVIASLGVAALKKTGFTEYILLMVLVSFVAVGSFGFLGGGSVGSVLIELGGLAVIWCLIYVVVQWSYASDRRRNKRQP